MKLLIVDDDTLICDGLKMIFELEDDFQVVGTGKNGEEAYKLCQEYKPDIVLMDIRMPICDGVIGASKIKAVFPEIKVVMLTTFKDTEFIKEALNCGAEGYILKSQPADSIVKSVRAVAKGSVVFEKQIALMIPDLMSKNNKKQPSDFNLTNREFDIIRLIGQGMSNKEISHELFIGEGTIRNNITIILEKLNLRDRTQLAIFYIHNFE
ncbi:MAG: two component transcriptional regulator, LuxR family [Haloplasmataceae bacterium]|jgi:DNA-binding NarL/FixJ family response regulator|nr:two component transcriptional regulator, LuxR family [Haloplasmataceae bacterium]